MDELALCALGAAPPPDVLLLPLAAVVQALVLLLVPAGRGGDGMVSSTGSSGSVPARAASISWRPRSAAQRRSAQRTTSMP